MSFKFKIDPKQTAKIEANFRKDIKDILGAQAVMREIGEFVTDRLRYQARTSKPINVQNSFEPLKKSTIQNRKYLEKYNTTDPTYSTTRSNLTITGALLNALNFVVKGPGLIEVLFIGQHPRYRGKAGAIGKSVSNADIAKWQAEGGRPVFDRSLEENQTIKSRVKSIALRYVRRGLKVRNRLNE